MKSIRKQSVVLSSFVLCVLAISAIPGPLRAIQAQPQDAKGTFRVEDGTPLKLRLQRTLSSADSQVDDRVDFDVIEEIKVNGMVVIPKGSVAWGTVTGAQPKRRMGKGGKLNVNIDAVRLADGEKAALRAVKDVKGGGHTGAMTGGMVATGIVFFPAAPLFLLMHGKDITIPKGTEITAYINGDVNLDPVKFATSGRSVGNVAVVGGSQQQSSQSTISSSELSTVIVKSVPDGAEIIVDGKFVGSTPSTLHLAPGDHTISLQRAGYKAWQRTMTVNPGGDITINATLDLVL